MDGLFDEIIEITIMDGCCIIQYLISLNICYLIHIYFRFIYRNYSSSFYNVSWKNYFTNQTRRK